MNMNMNMGMNQMNLNMMPNQFFNNNMNQSFNQINPNFINMNQMNQNFYQMNRNMINMNRSWNNINMNRNINQNNNINQIQKAEDVLPYIDEPKMILKFSTVSTIKKGTYINVKLPKSLTKSDLYSIAKKFQEDFYSKIILSCNNYLLKEDDTTIEGIEEGSIINIIEDIDFPDGSYYKELMKKNENYEKVHFQFKFNGNYSIINFPKNITASEMMKGTLSKLLLNSKSSRIIELSSFEPTKKISTFQLGKPFNIVEANPLENHWRFGKEIEALVCENNKYMMNVLIGDLNSIKELIKQINIGKSTKALIKLFIGQHEFLINEIKDFSLRSIGINDNFECKVEFDNSEKINI